MYANICVAIPSGPEGGDNPGRTTLSFFYWLGTLFCCRSQTGQYVNLTLRRQCCHQGCYAAALQVTDCFWPARIIFHCQPPSLLGYLFMALFEARHCSPRRDKETGSTLHLQRSPLEQKATRNGIKCGPAPESSGDTWREWWRKWLILFWLGGQ